LCAGCYLRGELHSMWERVNELVRVTGKRPISTEAANALRSKGVTQSLMGEFRGARIQMERGLAIFDLASDDDLTFQYGHGSSVGALANLPLGDVEQRVTMERTFARVDAISTPRPSPTAICSAPFRIDARGPQAAATRAQAPGRLARFHDIKQWQAFGVFFEGWLNYRAGALSCVSIRVAIST